MQFNVKKYYAMSITHKIASLLFDSMNNSTLEHVKSYPYLGVTLVDNLSWSDHVLKVVYEADCTLGLLWLTCPT